MKNKRLNILWVSHLLPFPPVGGARIRSYNLLKEMAKYHNIFFVGLFQGAHQKNSKKVEQAVLNINKFCQKVSVFPFSSFIGNISFVFLVVKSFFSRKSYKENWCKSKEMSDAFRAIIDTENIDLIHFDTISLLPHCADATNSIPYAIITIMSNLI